MPRPSKRARISSLEIAKNSEFDQNENMPDSDVYYVPSFISTELSDKWYSALLELDRKPTLKVFGREVVQSRKIAAYSTDPNLTLKYSGQVVDMKYEYPPFSRLGVKFNHVMLNLYEDGTVYIGNHRDNIENKVIASLSPLPDEDALVHKTKRPAEQLDDRKDKNSTSTAPVYRKSWILGPGSLVVMQGETQKHWKHEIAKESKVTKGRISLTFRQLINS
ncbi:hypothetical protein CPB84DRAFT_1788075 [Gymnopilus junonius]|uniref:Fe2OG dioxygenase domain-containing protein n=1 Tax=Gymnopilus junonius TaxID=109634 RepID=A0A9P5NGB5_GYMJU|nr:hypothetical protein CPB84DRAFT_1788075 [Gymnopilus junonius]